MYVAKFSKVNSFGANTRNSSHLHFRECPLCGSGISKRVWGINDFQFFSDSDMQAKRVDITDVQCSDCLCLYRNPCFTEEGFRTLFSEAGCSYGATEQRPNEQLRWLTERGLISAGKSFLDVGCYDGRFLSNLPSYIQRIGVDIDEPAILRGRSRDQGIKLYHSQFESFRPSETPDVITMFHVLEHLPSPRKVLARLADISSERCALVIEVPTLERGNTNDINGFFSTQHLTHFSRNTLSEILRVAGWCIEDYTDMDSYNGLRVLARKFQGTPIKPKPDASDTINLSQNLQNWKIHSEKIQEILSSLPLEGRFIIWGGGLHTEILFHFTELFSTEARHFLIVDNDPHKQGKSWRGIHIASPSCLLNPKLLFDRLIVSSYGNQKNIIESAHGLGIEKSKIVSLYDKFFIY